MVIPLVSDEKRFSETDQFGGIVPRAIAVAPIQIQGKVIGVLEAINPTSGTFDPDALLVMTGIGSLAGTTIQNAQFFEQIQIAHERYRELFEDSIDPILITNFDGEILEANRMAITMSGYDEEKFRQMSIDQIHEVNWGKIGLEFESLDGQETSHYESALHRLDGTTVPVIVYVRQVHFGGKEALQWTFHNISERKELDALRDDLTAMIYHDLRSPLANVVSSLDILSGVLADHADETVTSLMTIATNATARMQRLISSLLDINRLESGQQIASQEPVSPNTLVEDAVNAVRPSTDARAQKLVKHIAANIPHIYVDEDMIRRVLINLLENASKFSPSGSTIQIGAKVEDGWVKAWVQDDGPGISAEDRARVFEKFARAKGKEKISGLGIGLAFCRLAINGHGGHIWVENPDGKQSGARFCMTIPIAETN
ncbi:MAG: ATP-binding protein, partial [Anaerolineales bacterium]|nr:ATP-binding protein [Anaerolineales bacterium]